MKRKPKGYSLAETVMVVLFAGILTAIAVPRISFSAIRRKNAETISKKIVTVLRRTRRLAISDAANNQEGFELRMNGPSPYSSYDVVNLDTSVTVDSYTIDDGISCSGGANFKFGPLGNLLGSSDTQLTVSSEGKSFTVNLIQATGMVRCLEN